MHTSDDRSTASFPQATALQDAALEPQLDYWRQQFAGGVPPLGLPGDRPRPASEPLRHDRYTAALPQSLREPLLALARQEETTLFTVLLTALATLLYRYTGQPELVIGAVSGEQTEPQTGAQLGSLNNLLALRCDLDGDPLLRELLRRLRASTDAAQAHALPCDRLLRELTLDHSALFDVLLLLRPAAEATSLELETLAAHSALALAIDDSPDGLSITWIYAAEIFDPATIERMAGHLAVVLAGIAAQPQQSIARVPLLTAAEYQQIVVDWNTTFGDYPADQCLHTLVEAQAAQHPNVIAVVFEEQQLSYRELNARANQLAYHLRSLGVGPDTRVGLCIERSLELIVGVLAALKAGATYVPIDPNYPAERVQFMLRDAEALVLLTQHALLEQVAGAAPHTICLDRDWQEIAGLPSDNLANLVTPDHVAYVIYTSGSTGRPKGVMVQHRGVVSYTAQFSQDNPVVLGSRAGLWTSISFDVSVYEIFSTLGYGGTLYLVTEPTRSSGPEFMAWLERHQITHSYIPPFMMPDLAAYAAAEESNLALRRIEVGVEPLAEQMLASIARNLPGITILNGYGPTETSVCTTIYIIDPESSFTGNAPIGYPIPNTTIYILDAQLQPVPVGVAGEIYIGGVGVAQGYLKRPELTAERFLPDPFINSSRDATGARMYRSGDLARFRPDGAIDFLGRIDQQVKIRGFRVELGEIEATLRQHPQVREAVVLVHEDMIGSRQHKRLLAYVVENQEPRTKEESAELGAELQVPSDCLGATGLRAFLQDRLPDYMVPNSVILLPALPLLPNGKLDRKALPVPDTSTDDDRYVAPRSAVEATLAEIWAGILELERVGVHDHFFELGGNSLLATQILSQVRRVFGAEIPQRSLFEAPTIAELAEQIAGQTQTAAQPIPRVDRGQPLPQSFAQQRLWFIDQFTPGSAVYNTAAVLELRGHVELAALHRSLNAIVARHEALRTTFTQRVPDGTTSYGSEAIQVIAPSLELPLPLIEIGGQSAWHSHDEAHRQVAAEVAQPFDLQHGPLIRARLLRLDHENHWLLLSIHHIVSDGWSYVILLRELSALYAAAIDGRSAELPQLPVQYADYSVWQREWLQGEVLERQLDYWRRQLGGSLPVLDLPTDRPRPPAQTFVGARQDFLLSPALTTAIHRLERQEGATLFMVLLAAFNTLLYRYTGQNDLIVGSPIAGRTRVEVEPLIGFFVNTLALRTDLGGNPSFRELLGRVRESTLGAYSHQDLPFERLVEELQIERDVSRNPLFDVMFVLDPPATIELPGLEVRSWEPHNGTAKFDLTLSMQDSPAGISGMLEYNTALFEAATIARLSSHLELLLTAVTADPGQRIDTLPLLTAAEHELLFVEWNRTAADYCRDWCAHQIFEAQAARTPDAIAAVFEDQQISYRELEERANRLANHLRSLGVGPDVLVGLCVDRSLDLVVGFLGLLKAGGAYVPLDATYPTDRLKFILDDARSPVILTQEKLLAKLPPTEAALVCIDRDWPLIAENSAEQPRSGVTPENLTYVMYTSGTTGRPKGIAMPHRPLVNMITWQCRYMPGWPGVRALQFASLNFDVSYQELFTTWLEGGTIVVVAEDVRRDARALLRYLAEQQVERLFLPFALLQHLAEVGEEEDLVPTTLREIVAAGEQLQITRPIANWLRKLDGCTLYNEYGPSECHVVTALTLRGDPESWPALAPVGTTIANTEIYLLDRNWQPVPQGVPGEVYIGGVSLARGYLQRPDLTAEKFIPDWLSGRPGDRLYRTGDLARYLPDGNLFFLGRTDHQVKVRGFRIELGEIESVLRQHPQIRETAVIVREDTQAGGPAAKRIVAYVVENKEQKNREPYGRTKEEGANAKQGSIAADLRAYIKQHLPDYMLPSAFVVLDALPLTPHGKLDRRALPAPDDQRPLGATDVVAARTPLEEILCGIWTEVLGVAQVGVFDSFFDLGGHSLLATQIVSRVRQAFNVDLPLRVLFEEPTVARMAEHVTAARQSTATLQALPISVVERSDALPLSLAQQRFWFLDQWEPGNPAYHISLAIRLRGPLKVSALHGSLNTIIARHEALRTIFAVANGEPVQRIMPALSIELPLVDLAPLAEAERSAATRHWAVSDSRQPFDLAAGPLIRARLLRLSDQEHVLLLIIHHIASDGWSHGVLMRELTALYAAAVHEREAELPALPIQYADYSSWQRQWLQGEILESQLSYWRQRLAGRPPFLELPGDYPRPPVQTFNGGLYSFRIPDTIAAAARRLSRQEGATLFMLLLATFKTLLLRSTGQHDLLVGSPIAGRVRPELEPLIGCFINTLVLRTDLSGDPSFRDVLRRVRETTLGAYAHQDLPFTRLVEELQVERDVSRTPIFQIMFVLQSTPTEPIATSDLLLDPAHIDNQTTNLDFTLSMQDTAQGLTGDIEYNSDLFMPETIARLAEHFRVLLQAIVADPEQRIATLPLLTAAERQLLRDWNATATPSLPDRCVHELFAAQAARTPEATAVVFQEQRLSYAELEERANRLAQYLQSQGVGPETRVGLCLHRSLDLPVAVLGILKAGGCYVPLDPAYPVERLHFMLHNAAAPLVITEAALWDRLPADSARSICLDRDWPLIAQHSADAPAARTVPDHLAYVIYTSGSTGQPKGVAVSHRAIGNRIAWSQQADPLNDNDRVLQVASMSFDIAFWELIGPLLYGATVVLARPDANQDSEYLIALLREQRITVAHLVPSVLNLLLADPALASCRSLRSLYYGGEASATDLPERILAQLPVTLLHFYGPTEAAINATAWRGEPDARTPVSIGRPISNMQAYLLDRHGQPVPIGVVGELYLGGVGLARGYHGRPDLTAERFVPDPFGETAGARLYRTGDLARFRPDGEIVFVGRADDQVKIRGVRVELGEIEAVLRQQPGVREAVVVAREDGGDARLVAYIVENKAQQTTEQGENGEPGQELAPSPHAAGPADAVRSDGERVVAELRSRLKALLPAAMLPSAFVVMDALPLTPSGKIDRRALPAPELIRPVLDNAFVAPRTPVEQVIAGIWAKLLKQERIGVDDNFFELGGHSLLATQVVSRLRQIFQMNVPQRSIFEAQTIAGLARYLIASEPKPGQVEKVAQLVQRVKRMSSDDKRDTLGQKKPQ
jgi:amino acid adenylation domain-containing protein